MENTTELNIDGIFTDEYLHKYKGQPCRVRNMIKGVVSIALAKKELMVLNKEIEKKEKRMGMINKKLLCAERMAKDLVRTRQVE